MTKRSANGCPEARGDGLLTEAVGDELVIFDTETNEAHALKPLAAAVFAACDGSTPAAELAARVSAKLERVVDVADVDAAVLELEETGLMVDSGAVSGISRRRMLQVSGVAAAGVLVTSAVVPAYAAASTTSCQPTTQGSFGCQISQFGVIVQDQNGNYYAYVAAVGSGSFWAASCTSSLTLGGTSQTNCFHNNVDPYGYPLSPCPSQPGVLGFNVGASGIAVDLAPYYTLVGWFAHQGTTCYGLELTGFTTTGGCVQITNVCNVIG